MKNKLIKFILALSVAASSVNVGFANTDDVPDRSWILENKKEIAELTGDNLANYTLLSYLGIIREPKESFNGDEVALRGYAAEVAALMATEELFSASAAPYSDVLLTNKYVSGVYTAKSLGITPDGKKFNPLKPVSIDDAAAFIVKALGLKNAYPGYTVSQIVNNLELTEGIDSDKTEITKNDLMRMVINALNSNNIEKKYKNGNWVIEVDEYESILEKRENIILIKGIVTGDQTASLFNEKETAEGKIEINRNVYDVNYRPDGNLIGKSVIAYADADSENFIVFLAEDKKINTVTEVKKDDFEEIENKTVFYLNESGNRKRVNVDNGAKVIYNNLYAGDYSQYNFSEFDTLDMIDNDKDGDIDVFYLLKYDYYFADKISEYSMTISLYGSEDVITLSEDKCDYYNIRLAEGEESIAFSSIKQYDVLSVLTAIKSDDKKIYSIIISRKTVDGFLKGKEEDEDTLYNIDGGKYVLSAEYEKYLEENTSDPKPQIGENYIFYLSHDDKIVMSKQDSNKYSYAYLLKAYDLTDEEDVKIRVYTLTGEMREFTMSAKVKVFNESNLKGIKKNKEEVYPLLLEDGKLVNQMIAYKLDGQEKVKEIALEYDMTGKQPGTVEYPIVRNVRVGGDGVKTENGRLYEYVLGCGYYVPSRTTVLTVPSTPEKFDNILNFGLAQASMYSKDKYFDNTSLVVYNADKFYQAEFCISETSGGGVNMDRFLRAYMLTGVKHIVDSDDEPCIELEYVDEDGLPQSVMVTRDAQLSTPEAGQLYGVHGGIEDLKKGDIVQLDITAAGATGVRILMKSDSIGEYRTEKLKDLTVTQLNGASPFDQLGIMYGVIKDIGTSALVMNVSPEGDEAFTHMVRIDNNSTYDSSTFTLYERKTGKVITVPQSEIKKGDSVILRKRFHHATDLFIIR